jgi:hypothetical protein
MQTNKDGNDSKMLPLGAFFLLSAFVSSSLAAPHLKVISDS